MKILNWLIGERKNIIALSDAVWVTREAKFAGIKRLVNARFQAEDAPLAIILVAHFPDTLAELEKIAGADDIDGPVTATLSGQLNYVSTSAAIFGDSETIEIIVGERHPLRLHDEKVAEFAQGLPCRSRVTHHLALNDALLKGTVGNCVTSMLQKLGMKDQEPLASDLISQQIKLAQQKIVERVINDEQADSADAWMAKNLRA